MAPQTFVHEEVPRQTYTYSLQTCRTYKHFLISVFYDEQVAYKHIGFTKMSNVDLIKLFFFFFHLALCATIRFIIAGTFICKNCES